MKRHTPIFKALSAVIILAAILTGGCDQAIGSGTEKEPVTGSDLTGIVLSQWPDIIVYAKGQPFDPAGLVVEGTLADETTRELSLDEYVLSPVDTTIAGAKQVTVKAGAFSAWFPIMVNSSTAGLQSIALTKAPNKTLYALGEAFDKTGMVITGRYYDSEEGTFTEKTETVYAVVGYDPTRRGNKR